MPIDHVSISNFKSIRELSKLKLRPLNVLIGANGTGKSNFLDFFDLLQHISNDELGKFLAKKGYSNRLLHFGQKVSPSMSGSIVFKKQADHYPRNRYDFELKPDASKGMYFELEEAGYNFHIDYGDVKWDMQEITGYPPDRSGLLDELDVPERVSYLRSLFQDFKSFHFHDTSSSSALKQPARLRDNRYLREDGSNLPAFLYLLKEKHKSSYRLIEYAIRSIAPFFDRFELSPDELNDEMIYLSWKEKDSSEYFDAHNLSDGSLRFIALATVLLQPNPPATIIIDEPELGLHPAAINKLVGILQSVKAKSQIIISTQSINLLDQFEPEDIIVVDREEDQSVFKRLSRERLSQWLEAYSVGQLWGKNIIGGMP